MKTDKGTWGHKQPHGHSVIIASPSPMQIREHHKKYKARSNSEIIGNLNVGHLISKGDSQKRGMVSAIERRSRSSHTLRD